MELRQGAKTKVTLRLRRPSTGAMYTEEMKKGPMPPGPAPELEARLVDGDVAYVQLPGFFPDVADKVLVALTDRGCASACDAFTVAVKDLRLGTLVGTRTAGAVAGPRGPGSSTTPACSSSPDATRSPPTRS